MFLFWEIAIVLPGPAPRIDVLFILRETRLSNKLLKQGYIEERLKSSLKKFYGRYGDLIKQYKVPLSRMLNSVARPNNVRAR